jgi:hypothetical protein
MYSIFQNIGTAKENTRLYRANYSKSKKESKIAYQELLGFLNKILSV